MHVVTEPLAVMEPDSDREATAVEVEELSYDSCVPRRLVHKKAVSEVFLTDARRESDDRFTVAAQWPRDHVFFQPGAEGTSDPLLWIETVRQAGIYLSHRFYDVPLGHLFILSRVDFAIDTPAPARPGPAPLAVTLDVTCAAKLLVPGKAVMSLEAVVFVDGHRSGQVSLDWQAVDANRYQRVRNRHSGQTPYATAPAVHDTVPLPPQAIGRRNERDVVLAGAIGTLQVWNLSVDRGHPVLFDHGCDHIPGVALIESFRQAGALTAATQAGTDRAPHNWFLQSGSISFASFGELDQPVIVVVRNERQEDRADRVGPAGGREIQVAALQGDRPLAAAVLTGVTLTPLGELVRDGGE